jgi:four helix bundle protein
MALRNFRELRSWQLASQLRKEVTAICATSRVAEHFSFCNDFAKAAGSVCHNLSEGFIRFSSAEIVRFFTYSLASLGEVQDYLEECVTRSFITKEEFGRLLDLTEHVKATSLNFMKPHLERLERRRREKRRNCKRR